MVETTADLILSVMHLISSVWRNALFFFCALGWVRGGVAGRKQTQLLLSYWSKHVARCLTDCSVKVFVSSVKCDGFVFVVSLHSFSPQLHVVPSCEVYSRTWDALVSSLSLCAVIPL